MFQKKIIGLDKNRITEETIASLKKEAARVDALAESTSRLGFDMFDQYAPKLQEARALWLDIKKIAPSDSDAIDCLGSISDSIHRLFGVAVKLIEYCHREQEADDLRLAQFRNIPHNIRNCFPPAD